MMYPLAFFIGFRYTRAKRRNHFISFISLISMLGIALGVTVLITVLSVMNGFDEQIRNHFFALAPQVTVMTRQNILSHWPSLKKQLQTVPHVLFAAPYLSGQGMLINAGEMSAVNILGVIPHEETGVSQIGKEMIAGSLNSLQPGSFRMVLGKSLADRLGVEIGDQVNLFVPQANTTPLGILPRFRRFTISGIFHAGNGFDFDLGVVYIPMEDANKLLADQALNGLHVKLTDLYRAGQVSQRLREILPSEYAVTDWTVQSGAFFQALAMQKTMLFLILSLIIAVAVFNLVSTLMMVVNDKQADIAILRTLGAPRSTIMSAFIVQGGIVGVVGTLLGLIGGLALAMNVTELTNFIQKLFNVQFISSSVYFIDYLPSKIKTSDVINICFISLGLSLLATLYPAWIAFRTQPAEALRYE